MPLGRFEINSICKRKENNRYKLSLVQSQEPGRGRWVTILQRCPFLRILLEPTSKIGKLDCPRFIVFFLYHHYFSSVSF